MKTRFLLCALIIAFLTFQTIPVAALDEGMCTLNNVPREDIKRKYGFDVSDEWLLQANLRQCVSHGSGAFVSPIVWCSKLSHRRRLRGELSSATKDYAKDGFVANTQAAEMKAKVCHWTSSLASKTLPLA